MSDRWALDHMVSRPNGEVAEWLKAPDSKSGLRETVTGVRIPSSPPFHLPPKLRFEPVRPKGRTKQHGESLPLGDVAPKGRRRLSAISSSTEIKIRTCSAEGPNQTTRGIPSFRRRSPKGAKAALRHFQFLPLSGFEPVRPKGLSLILHQRRNRPIPQLLTPTEAEEFNEEDVRGDRRANFLN